MHNDISVRQFKYSTSCFVFVDSTSTSLPGLRVFGRGIADDADIYYRHSHLVLQSQASTITEPGKKYY